MPTSWKTQKKLIFRNIKDTKTETLRNKKFRLIMCKESKSTIKRKIPQTNKSPGPNDYTGEFY